jgi:hypothetical protein
MLGNHKLILDTHCEIYDMIKNRADGIFWNFEQHVQKNEIVPGAVYVIGREQASRYSMLVQDLIKSNTISVVYSNPNEGSEPMEWNLLRSGFVELLAQRQMLVVTGGNINSAYPQLLYENFLVKVHDYTENIQAIQDYAVNQQTERPYKFLFLNGRMRDHRKYLLNKLQETGLLDQSLWTNLDSSTGVGAMQLTDPMNTLHYNYINNTIPVHYLPAEHEVDRYRSRTLVPTETLTDRLEGKFNLFDNEWGEIYLNPRPYLDTYFSLVTETVFDYPYSFRTEKLWKPMAIGHPFIVATGRGYYRDLHNLGFRTFGHLIDESFDLIDNNQQRIERIANVVEDLCKQDLAAFIKECYNVCKYNQQHLEEMRLKVRQEFPDRFFQFINEHFNE